MPIALAVVLLLVLAVGTLAALAPAVWGGRPWSQMRAVVPLIAVGWAAFALLILL